MQKITPFLWFDNQAEEAMDYYVSVFKNSKVVNVMRYGESGPGKKGTVMTGTLEIEGQQFYVLNGGPQFKFTPAISFFISCVDQKEIDFYWEKLSEGGRKDRCGWLQDKFGLSWQVVPKDLGRLMHTSDPAKSAKVMAALMKMEKIDIRDLEEAHG